MHAAMRQFAEALTDDRETLAAVKELGAALF